MVRSVPSFLSTEFALARLGWEVAVRSIKGHRRPDSQDAWSTHAYPTSPGTDALILGVFDGVGGMPNGGAAARAAAGRLGAVREGPDGPGGILRRLNQAVRATGGATTAVIAVLDDEGGIEVASVGDSAAFVRGRNGVETLTAADALGPDRLIGWLGQRRPRIQRATHRLERGGSLLLCSDGVHHVAPVPSLARVFQVRRPEDGLNRLFRRLGAAGLPDDATAVLARRS